MFDSMSDKERRNRYNIDRSWIIVKERFGMSSLGMSTDHKESLLDRLKKYAASNAYPLHMPGHKRQADEQPMKQFENPFTVDITEIDGFDNLHHAEGILKDCMENAANVYGTKKTYFLVNGSSSGILAAVSACVAPAESFLMARNCHKSVYHGVFLRNLKTEYLYPQICGEWGIQGGISPDLVDNQMADMAARAFVLLLC